MELAGHKHLSTLQRYRSMRPGEVGDRVVMARIPSCFVLLELGGTTGAEVTLAARAQAAAAVSGRGSIVR